MTKTRKYKKYKKYFVKKSEGLLVANYEYFNSIDSWVVALAIGISCYNEIQKTMICDSDGDDSYIGNMKVTTGLERSLQELNERYPLLMKEIHTASLMKNGIRLNRC